MNFSSLYCVNLRKTLIYSVAVCAASLLFFFKDIKRTYYVLLSSFNKYELSLVGPINPEDSVSNHLLLFSTIYSEWIDYNLIPLYQSKNLLQKDVSKLVSKAKIPGKVILYLGILPHYERDNDKLDKIIKLINRSHLSREEHILIAYTMFESTAIPQNWVELINKNFDMVVIPDEFLRTVYQNAGVKRPIFALPLPIIYNVIKSSEDINQKKFIFGNLSSVQDRKNHIKLLEAFKIVNSQRQNTFLHLSTRTIEENETKKSIYSFIQQNDLKNISFVSQVLSSEAYQNFISNANAFVYPAKGEGFAIQPRESMLRGKPTIITNNTAHRTICRTGLAKCVKADTEKAAFYEFSPPLILGNNFDCTAEDLADAMLDVYDNYEKYAAKGDQMRQWVVDNYSPDALRARYINMVKPKKVILGDRNEITDEYLITNSEELYRKYSKLTNN